MKIDFRWQIGWIDDSIHTIVRSGPWHIWWNFVSSAKERIEQAKADWQTGRFALVPGETELTPLPER